MNEEVRKRLDAHKALAASKAEAEQQRISLEQMEQEKQQTYERWRRQAIADVLEPAWAEAIATLRAADYIVDEKAPVDGYPDQWVLIITSPHSTKEGRSMTLTLDRLGYGIAKGKSTTTYYAPVSATKDDVAELIVDNSTLDFVSRQARW